MTAEAVIPFSAAAFIGRRCNPYGAETGGPKRILGGLHGPDSARVDTDDVPGLPDAIIQGEWVCKNLAQVTVRMTCRCGHLGAQMELCSWHDEPHFHGEYIAGKIRQVKDIRKVHGHYEEISRRQAGACPRCLYPGGYAEWYKALFAWQQELAMLRDTGRWYTSRGNYVRQKIEDIVSEFDKGNADGTIHRCPMTLVPVS
jgi:hypothetical protein